MVTYGKGGWNWADLYAMPVFLRNFYLNELVLAVKKENDAHSAPQGVPSHSFPKGPAIMRK